MNQTNKIISNSIYLYAKMCITAFVNLYTVRLLLSALGEIDYGIYNIVGGIIALFLFLNSSMAIVTQRFLSYNFYDKIRLNKIFNITVFLHFLIALFVVVLLELVKPILFANFINIPLERMEAASWVYHISVITTAITVMTVPYEGVLNAYENMLYYSIVGLLETALKLIVAIVVTFWLKDKLVLYGILTLFQTIVVLGIMRIYCHKKYEECKFNFKVSLDIKILKEMFGFLGWNFIYQFSFAFSGNGVNLVLNHFFGPTLNAAQSVATQVKNQSQALSAGMLKAFSPIIAKSEGMGDRDKMLYATLVSIKFTTFMFLILALPLFLFADKILFLWLKDVPQWTLTFVQFVLVIALFERLFSPLVIAINAQGNVKTHNLLNTLFGVIQLPILYATFYCHGASYWLYIIQFVFGNLCTSFVTLYFCHRNCGLKYSSYVRKVLLPLFPCVVLTLLVGISWTNYVVCDSFFTLLVGIVIVDFILSVTFYFLAMKIDEKIRVREYFFQVIRKR